MGRRFSWRSGCKGGEEGLGTKDGEEVELGRVGTCLNVWRRGWAHA